MNLIRLLLTTASTLAITVGLVACSAPGVRARADDKQGIVAKAEPPLSEIEVDALLTKVVELHNLEREKADLPPLEVHPRLVKAARRHAADMAKQNKMSHEGSDKSTPFVRIKGAGYGYRYAGENVARRYRVPSAVMQGWMDSPPHRKNVLLDKYSQIGVALAFAEDGTFYWCVTFGLPKQQ